MPEALVRENADRSLRDSGAVAIHTQRIDIPARYGVIAARASGALNLGDRTLHVQYTYYAVNTPAGGALIERAVTITDQAYVALSDELYGLDTNLRAALLASIDRAPKPQNTPETSGGVHPAHARMLPPPKTSNTGEP